MRGLEKGQEKEGEREDDDEIDTKLEGKRDPAGIGRGPHRRFDDSNFSRVRVVNRVPRD